MLNDLNKRPNGEGQPERDVRPAGENHAVGEREVPLLSGNAYAAMHRWLDGEGTAAEAMRGEAARYVDLWRHIGAESERYQSATAPAGLTERIMAALPDAVPQRTELRMSASAATVAFATTAATAHAPVSLVAPTETSWWQRPVELNHGTALAAAAGLLLFGAVLGSAFGGR